MLCKLDTKLVRELSVYKKWVLVYVPAWSALAQGTIQVLKAITDDNLE
ncbi:hypothetical protein [Lysinibacillus sphaericus]|nr:hypothetical protein [Lysinibacillus sp. SDF0037]